MQCRQITVPLYNHRVTLLILVIADRTQKEDKIFFYVMVGALLINRNTTMERMHYVFGVRYGTSVSNCKDQSFTLNFEIILFMCTAESMSCHAIPFHSKPLTALLKFNTNTQDLRRDTSSGVSVESDPRNPSHLIGTLRGPDDTPYARGTFEVDIIIPEDYPFTPPKMKFITKRKYSSM